ncbi:MAG: cation transporter [Oscillospiraceae bacterium]|nr:cation transporter [Oscillospiraceae bacterium]
MKKVYRLEDLDCANCARKMQDAIAKIEGVSFVSISFMTQKMTLEADDANFDSIIEKAQQAISRIEPDCRLVK